MTYQEKLKDPRWQRMRLEVMQRDRWFCRDCSDGARELQVHHCFYESGDPWEMPSDLLITLCGPCHRSRQAKERQVRKCIAVGLATLSAHDLNRVSTLAEPATMQAASIVIEDVAMMMARANYEKLGAA